MQVKAAAAMTEPELESAVRRLVKDLGLLGYHTKDSRRSEPGFPDWVIVGPYGTLFRELKSQHGRLTGDQTRWRYALRAAGQDCEVWRPSDLLAGTVAAELTAIAGSRSRVPRRPARDRDI
jgi:hypothetical protein